MKCPFSGGRKRPITGCALTCSQSPATRSHRPLAAGISRSKPIGKAQAVNPAPIGSSQIRRDW